MARSTNGGGAGRTRKHSLLRAARNKLTGKYARQRVRTEANKARRRAAHQAAHPNDHTTTKGEA